MTVPAEGILTLSQKFYDRFGDEITNELVDWFNAVDATYRAELRDLNELNFARFDAKLEQRVSELRQEMAEFRSAIRQEMAEFKSEIRQEMAEFKEAVRQELAALREEVSTLRLEMRAEVSALRLEMGGLRIEVHGQFGALREENTGLRGDMERGLERFRADLLKWMFGFWATTSLTLIGLILAILRTSR